MNRLNVAPEATWRVQKQRAKTYIYVNRHNKTKQQKLPVITVKRGNKTYFCNQVSIFGFCQLIYDPENPKPCSATVWLEVDPETMISFG